MSHNFVSRLQIALLVGTSLFVLTFLTYWNWSRDTLMGNYTLSYKTGQTLRRVSAVLEDRIGKRVSLPQSLSEISSEMDTTPEPGPGANGTVFSDDALPFIKNGTPVDGWGRPLHYSAEGTSYTILSYGRDGKPGGKGLDCDNGMVYDPEYEMGVFIEFPDHDRQASTYMPTLYQFLFELPSKGMIQSCFLTGGLAFIMTLFLVRSVPASRREQTFCTIKIVVTIVMSFIFASLIINLHVPTGH
jgi:hypothetical protein